MVIWTKSATCATVSVLFCCCFSIITSFYTGAFSFCCWWRILSETICVPLHCVRVVVVASRAPTQFRYRPRCQASYTTTCFSTGTSVLSVNSCLTCGSQVNMFMLMIRCVHDHTAAPICCEPHDFYNNFYFCASCLFALMLVGLRASQMKRPTWYWCCCTCPPVLSEFTLGSLQLTTHNNNLAVVWRVKKLGTSRTYWH